MRSHTLANLAASPALFLHSLRVVNIVDSAVLLHAEVCIDEFSEALCAAAFCVADSTCMPGEARPGDFGSNGVNSSVGATNKLIVQERQDHAAVTLSHIAGICLAIVLLTHQNECLDGGLQAAAYIEKHAFEEQVKWLMGAPAGRFHTCPNPACMCSPVAQPACT